MMRLKNGMLYKKTIKHCNELHVYEKIRWENHDYCNYVLFLACEPYKYGPDCTGICGRCKHGISCSVDTGACPDGCEEGWTGKRCDTCIPIYFFYWRIKISFTNIIYLMATYKWTQCFYKNSRFQNATEHESNLGYAFFCITSSSTS